MIERQEVIRAAFEKWVNCLGLAWWEIQIAYYDDPGEIVRQFRQADNGDVVAAFVDANWMYAEATICINLPLFAEMTDEKIERIVVHELMHILVNEMREGEIHHEERVVTQLTKAIFWTVKAHEEE